MYTNYAGLRPGGKPCPEQIPLQIFVRSLDGSSRPVLLDRHEPMRSLKGRVEAWDGIPATDQRLIYAGRQLADDATAESANLQSGSTVHLLLRLRGGIFVEAVEIIVGIFKTIILCIKRLWNWLFGKRCCVPPASKSGSVRRGPCWCSVAESDEETDESYDDITTDESDEESGARPRRPRKMRNADGHPIWQPPSQPPPLPPNPTQEDLRVHRSLFNMRDDGAWRIAPYPEQVNPADPEADDVGSDGDNTTRSAPVAVVQLNPGLDGLANNSAKAASPSDAGGNSTLHAGNSTATNTTAISEASYASPAAADAVPAVPPRRDLP